MKKIYKKPTVIIKNDSQKQEISAQQFEYKIRASKNIILREIAGEYLLIPIGKAATRIKGIVSLTESGCLLWRFIQNGATESQLVELILREYIVDRDTAVKDVKSFIEKMRKTGILEEGNESDE